MWLYSSVHYISRFLWVDWKLFSLKFNYGRNTHCRLCTPYRRMKILAEAHWISYLRSSMCSPRHWRIHVVSQIILLLKYTQPLVPSVQENWTLSIKWRLKLNNISARYYANNKKYMERVNQISVGKSTNVRLKADSSSLSLF
jgi:hypothetical protein